MSPSISRRDVLKSLAMSAAATSVLRVIPAQAAEYAHHMVAAEKAAAPAKAYAPKFFSAHDYKTLQVLCQTIIPADGDSGGAIEAGAPAFIGLLTNENPDYPRILCGGLLWLGCGGSGPYREASLPCHRGPQKAILCLIAHKNKAISHPPLQI